MISWLRQAYALRQVGDESAAQVVIDIARKAQATLRAAGRSNANRDVADAMLAILDDQPAHALVALESAAARALLVKFFLDDAIFDVIRTDPAFVALQDGLLARGEADHENILRLICFDNPIPEDWRPLPETCADVTK